MGICILTSVNMDPADDVALAQVHGPVGPTLFSGSTAGVGAVINCEACGICCARLRRLNSELTSGHVFLCNVTGYKDAKQNISWQWHKYSGILTLSKVQCYLSFEYEKTSPKSSSKTPFHLSSHGHGISTLKNVNTRKRPQLPTESGILSQAAEFAHFCGFWYCQAIRDTLRHVIDGAISGAVIVYFTIIETVDVIDSAWFTAITWMRSLKINVSLNW